MGRKEISQMTFFNFVSAIAIGSIAANLVVNQNLTVRNGIIALAGWTLFTLAMDLLDIKSKKARTLLTGEPIIVIKGGKIVEKALGKSRLDLDSLTAMLRQRDVFSMKDVEYAIYETNGNLSVMRTNSNQPVAISESNLHSPKSKTYPLAAEVISDGKILHENLSKLNLSPSWLEEQLQLAGITSASDVFFAQVQQDGSLYIDKKKDVLH